MVNLQPLITHILQDLWLDCLLLPAGFSAGFIKCDFKSLHDLLNSSCSACVFQGLHYVYVI